MSDNYNDNVERCKQKHGTTELSDPDVVSKKRRVPSGDKNKCLRLDFHTHILPKNLPDFKKQFGYGEDWVMFDHDQEKVKVKGNCRMMKNDSFFREIEPNCWDVDARITDMDRDGIDIQVLCTVPVMFSYWAEPEHTVIVSKFLNDDLATEVSRCDS